MEAIVETTTSSALVETLREQLAPLVSTPLMVLLALPVQQVNSVLQVWLPPIAQLVTNHLALCRLAR